ncbi:hypothetical protein EJ110_NYTH53319 [Nymphaea thermarum]|nr:hypothetical protein EJ110_NYTH53319 [Nymphaea thermarum]
MITVSYLGLKETIPPYLDYTLGDKDLLTGVNFASAGSGFDPLTAKISGVIPVCDQLEYVEEYIYRVEKILGREGTAALISNSLILIACGGNDFIVNYFVLPVRRQKFSVEEYQDFVLELLRQTIQVLKRSHTPTTKMSSPVSVAINFGLTSINSKTLGSPLTD